MSVQESYSAKIAGKTNFELIQIIENSNQFKDEVVLVAITEMENRGISHNSIGELKDDLLKKQTNRVFSNLLKNTEKAKENEELGVMPKMYSNMAIYIGSVMFGVYFGGILFIINLISAKAKGVFETILFVVLYMLVMASIIQNYKMDLAIVFLLNAVGGMLFNTLLKRQFLSHVTKYKRRNSIVPMVVGIGIALLIYTLIGGEVLL
jgi:hypothetical protein